MQNSAQPRSPIPAAECKLIYKMNTDYTLILNYYNKPEELLIRQVDKILNQTLPPKCIWACFLGVPEENKQLITTFKYLTGHLDNVYIIESDYNFKYIGRYQLALSAPTDYIVMLDDDRLPEKDYCRTMVEIVSQKECLVGQHGWQLDKRNIDHCFKQHPGTIIKSITDMAGVLFSSRNNNPRYSEGTLRLIEGDYLCGGMTFRKSSLVHLFKEPLYTVNTGEDIMFCLRCKKNGIPTHIYQPSAKYSQDTFLGHDSMGHNYTASTLDIILERSEIIQKELSYPHGTNNVPGWDYSKTKKPKENAFDKIYKTKRWRRGSGIGSTIENNLKYLDLLKQFIQDNNIKSIADIGCGDFQFMKELPFDEYTYTGYDYSSYIINQNKENHKRKNVNFIHSDEKTNFAAADLFICKDVLQHIPENKIHPILNQINKYKYCIITNDISDTHNELFPASSQAPATIIEGDWRTIDIRENPFNLYASVFHKFPKASTPHQGIRKIALLLINGNKTNIIGDAKP